MKENETTDLSILKGFCLLEPSTVLLVCQDMLLAPAEYAGAMLADLATRPGY